MILAGYEYAKLVENRMDSGSVIPDTDPALAHTFASMPQCSGVAMGLDRLLMLLMDKRSLQGVILFPLSDMLRNGDTRNL